MEVVGEAEMWAAHSRSYPTCSGKPVGISLLLSSLSDSVLFSSLPC